MVTSAVQSDEVSFLPRVELGLLATEPSLGRGCLDALASTEPDQVGLNSATMASTLPSRQGVNDLARVGQGPGKAIELGDYERVARAAGSERLA